MTKDIVFLFGAGASYGAGEVLPYSPPLMRDLYDELAQHFPGQWGPESQLASYAERFRNNFETTFYEEVLTFCKGVPRADSLSLLEKQIPLALYFSKFTVHEEGRDYYSRLLRSIKRDAAYDLERCLFCSINYDCLFEQAACVLGLKVSYSCDQALPDTIPILKLHGSCNFVTSRLSQRDRCTLSCQGVHFEIALSILEPVAFQEKLARAVSGSSPDHLPVMSQVSPHKELFVAPAQVQKSWHEWTEAISSSTTIVIIGVSFNPNDKHVVKPIAEASSRLLYIGDSNSFGEWKRVHSNSEHINETLHNGYEALLKELRICMKEDTLQR